MNEAWLNLTNPQSNPVWTTQHYYSSSRLILIVSLGTHCQSQPPPFPGIPGQKRLFGGLLGGQGAKPPENFGEWTLHDDSSSRLTLNKSWLVLHYIIILQVDSFSWWGTVVSKSAAPKLDNPNNTENFGSYLVWQHMYFRCKIAISSGKWCSQIPAARRLKLFFSILIPGSGAKNAFWYPEQVPGTTCITL